MSVIIIAIKRFIAKYPFIIAFVSIAALLILFF